MSIENSLERIARALEVIAGNPDGPLAATAAAIAAVAPNALPAQGVDKPKKGRPSKSAEGTGTAPAPVAAATSQASTTSAPGAAAGSSGPMKEDVRAALQALQSRSDAATVKALLAKFNSQTVTQVPEEKYAAVIKLANETGGTVPEADPFA